MLDDVHRPRTGGGGDHDVFEPHPPPTGQIEAGFDAERVPDLERTLVARDNVGVFVLLDADPIHDHRTLQDSVFAKIRRSSFLTSFNEGGYLGKAALLEYGYAISIGIPILTLEPAEDPNIRPYTRLLSDDIGPFELKDGNALRHRLRQPEHQAS